MVTVTGPRQSGKTTLCRTAFPDKAYVNLEQPDVRAFARDDPRGFLRGYPGGAILDEFQRAPELPSYLQSLVDEDAAPGRYILTGSEQLEVLNRVSQSLAGSNKKINPPGNRRSAGKCRSDAHELSAKVRICCLMSIFAASYYGKLRVLGHLLVNYKEHFAFN